MILIDKMKNMKIYKSRTFWKTLRENKKKGAITIILSPNFESTKKVMNNKMFINNGRYESYYTDRDVAFLIGSNKEIEDIDESAIIDEQMELFAFTETKRSELPDSAFGVPSKRKFPLDTEAHVRSAIKFFNYVDEEDEAELARRIIAAMKKFNITDVNVSEKNRFSKYYHHKKAIDKYREIYNESSDISDATINSILGNNKTFKPEPEEPPKFNIRAEEKVLITPNGEKVKISDLMNESILINEKDIYYNKDKFDSGEINLCFITGHSGSGKSTMSRDIQNKQNAEHYELDDLMCIKDYFSMDNLKEYGDLIYSYFKGPGKKFYITYDELVANKTPGSEYEDILYRDFVHYAMAYASHHKDRKFVIEGVWLFCVDENKVPYFKPEEFKNYAFYIKGTSMIVSKYRAARRDAKEDYKDNKLAQFRGFSKAFFLKNWQYYKIDEKRINAFRNYFKSKSE